MVHRQRAATDSAVCGCTASGTGHQRRVAGTWHLNEHWSVLQSAPQRSMGEGRDAGCSGRALPVQLSWARDLHPRHRSAHNVPWCRQVLAPSLLHERVRFHGAGESADEQSGTLQR